MSVRGTVFEVRRNTSDNDIELLVYDGKVGLGLGDKPESLYTKGEYTKFEDKENPNFIVERSSITDNVMNDRMKQRLSEILKDGRDIIELPTEDTSMLDKFIGDAVMAVYNAPLDIENYEKKAIMTGLNILKELENLNKELKEKNGTEIAYGIGIHCGKAVVGNIGCSYRMDYTVIGDTVNIAERLESIAKGGKINISKEVYDRVKDEFDAIPKGSYMLKGKNKEVFVYEMGVVYESENV